MVRRIALVLGAAAIAAATNVTAAVLDPPAPPEIQKAAVEEWIVAAGIDTKRLNILAATPKGVYLGEKMVGLGGAKSRSVDLRFEWFAPRILLSGSQVRSEHAQFIVECGKDMSIKLSRAKAYELHGLKGASSGDADRALWEPILASTLLSKDPVGQRLSMLRVNICMAQSIYAQPAPPVVRRR